MKKLTCGFLVSALVVAAFGAGFLAGTMTSDPGHGGEHAAEQDVPPMPDLQQRIEAFEPGCEQLRSPEPTLTVTDTDAIVVMPGIDYFYVVGIRAGDHRPPETAWWGASMEHAESQACGQ